MLIAGAVNMAMLLVAATNLQGRADTDSIEGAHAAVRDTLGPTVALFFAIGLLASGLASTSVGAYAGAMIMQGLLRKSFPLLVRRLVTLIPALVVLAHRRRSQPRARHLPGGAVLRHPVRARAAGAPDQQPGPHGLGHQPSPHLAARVERRGGHYDSQRGPDLPDTHQR